MKSSKSARIFPSRRIGPWLEEAMKKLQRAFGKLDSKPNKLHVVHNSPPLATLGSHFQVGGEEGWVKPTGNQTEAYNHWATRHRFHIGDSVYFRYEEDSVLVVSSSDYENCRTSHPISKFDDGNTVFQFERSGLFYFISGQPGHCKSGQRLVIRVMHPSEEVEPPQAAPSPAAPNPNGGGGEDIWDNSNNWGPPALNSTDKLTVASYFMTFLGGVIVFLYWLM